MGDKDSRFEEAAFSVLRDILIAFHMNLFHAVESSDPTLSARLKPDFDQWIEAEIRLGTALKGDYTIYHVRRELPDNAWDKFVCETLAEMKPEVSVGVDNEDLLELIKKKLAGLDVQ